MVRGTLIVNNARSVGALKVFGHFGILRRGLNSRDETRLSWVGTTLASRDETLFSTEGGNLHLSGTGDESNYKQW